MQVRGSLKKAQRVSHPESGSFTLRGTIWGDTKQEYRDGWFIYTAVVMQEIQPNVFRTATGNIYRVEEWAAPSKPSSEYSPIPVGWPFYVILPKAE